MNPVEISADQFRRLAERVTNLAGTYLETIDAQAISPATSGDETLRLFRTAMPEAGIGEDALNALPEVMRLSRVQNGRFFGYVLGSGEPVGAVADLLASVVNQNVTAWRSGPAAVLIEQTVVGWLSQA
ncbi:MAG: pyridoxal-dependent decarboxylase, partial [Acidobacteria bacterium]